MAVKKKKATFWEFFQGLGKTFMLPVALLAFMGILLGLGSSFSSESMIETVPFLGKPAVKIIFQFMSTIGGFAFAYLPVMFAMAIPLGLVRKEKGIAAFSGFVGYTVMNLAINFYLVQTNRLVDPEQLREAGQGMVFGIQTVEMGASALVSIYPATGKQLQDYGIHNIVTLSEEIGKVIRGTYADEQEKRQALVEVTDGFELFQGKILDVEREVKGGFNLGRVKLSGLNSDAGSEAVVHFQNENLIAEKDGQVIAMTPDLICMVDLETLTPVTTESLKYGKRVQVMGLKANAAWRTKKGIETVGPRYFGYEMDYQPLENLVAKEDK